MSYTMTFDASHKVKGGNGPHLKNFIEHIARDVDEANGKKPIHRKNVMQSRTKFNETMIADGSGGFRPLNSIKELRDAINDRLSTVKKTIRKDAVLIRPFVIHIGRDWYEEHCPDWREGILTPKANRLHEVIMKWTQEEFGVENIPGRSLHLDEYSPQLQIPFIPVTDDGRLSQQDFFRDEADLVRQHNSLRQRLRDEGFDVTMDRVTKDRDPEFKKVKTELFREAAESIEADRAEVDAELADLPNARRTAKTEGHADGYAVGIERGEADAAARVASAEVQADQTTKRAQITAQRAITDAEREAESIVANAKIKAAAEGIEARRAMEAAVQAMRAQGVKPTKETVEKVTTARSAYEEIQAALRSGPERDESDGFTPPSRHGLGD